MVKKISKRKKTPLIPEPSSPMDKFDKAMKKIVSVPKKKLKRSNNQAEQQTMQA